MQHVFLCALCDEEVHKIGRFQLHERQLLNNQSLDQQNQQQPNGTEEENEYKNVSTNEQFQQTIFNDNENLNQEVKLGVQKMQQNVQNLEIQKQAFEAEKQFLEAQMQSVEYAAQLQTKNIKTTFKSILEILKSREMQITNNLDARIAGQKQEIQLQQRRAENHLKQVEILTRYSSYLVKNIGKNASDSLGNLPFKEKENKQSYYKPMIEAMPFLDAKYAEISESSFASLQNAKKLRDLPAEPLFEILNLGQFQNYILALQLSDVQANMGAPLEQQQQQQNTQFLQQQQQQYQPIVCTAKSPVMKATAKTNNNSRNQTPKSRRDLFGAKETAVLTQSMQYANINVAASNANNCNTNFNLRNSMNIRSLQQQGELSKILTQLDLNMLGSGNTTSNSNSNNAMENASQKSEKELLKNQDGPIQEIEKFFEKNNSKQINNAKNSGARQSSVMGRKQDQVQKSENSPPLPRRTSRINSVCSPTNSKATSTVNSSTAFSNNNNNNNNRYNKNQNTSNGTSNLSHSRVRGDTPSFCGSSVATRAHSKSRYSPTNKSKVAPSKKYSFHNQSVSDQVNEAHQKSVNNTNSVFDSQHLLAQNEHFVHMSLLAKNPLEKRIFIEQAQSEDAVFLKWSHPSYEVVQILYKLEFGIGMKSGGKELFREVYAGDKNHFTIKNLQPNTSYRVRVKAIYETNKSEISEKENESENNEWSDVLSITTTDVQGIDLQSLKQHAVLSKICPSPFTHRIIFDKPGLIFGSQPLFFGVFKFQIRVQASQHNAPDDNACVQIGIMNKMTSTTQTTAMNNCYKRKIVGSILNYGLNKQSYIVDVTVDIDKGQMVVKSPFNKNGEVFNSLPPTPFFPAIQNKTNQKNAFKALQLDINFAIEDNDNDDGGDDDNDNEE